MDKSCQKHLKTIFGRTDIEIKLYFPFMFIEDLCSQTETKKLQLN
jgi:hypothetical protein